MGILKKKKSKDNHFSEYATNVDTVAFLSVIFISRLRAQVFSYFDYFRHGEMSSEGSREACGLETAKGAVRERIGLARQPRHSRVQGITEGRRGEEGGGGRRGRDAFAKRLAIARFPLIEQAPPCCRSCRFPPLANVFDITRCRNSPS